MGLVFQFAPLPAGVPAARSQRMQPQVRSPFHFIFERIERRRTPVAMSVGCTLGGVSLARTEFLRGYEFLCIHDCICWRQGSVALSHLLRILGRLKQRVLTPQTMLQRQHQNMLKAFFQCTVCQARTICFGSRIEVWKSYWVHGLRQRYRYPCGQRISLWIASMAVCAV
jgi:hypothetical protein